LYPSSADGTQVDVVETAVDEVAATTEDLVTEIRAELEAQDRLRREAMDKVADALKAQSSVEKSDAVKEIEKLRAPAQPQNARLNDLRDRLRRVRIDPRQLQRLEAKDVEP
jgi:hypothetical protein